MEAKNIKINPKVFFKINFLIITTLISLHIIFQLCNYYFSNIPSFPDIRIYNSFNLGVERNIPTAYQASMIFISSILLVLLALSSKSKKDKLYFGSLSFLFFYIGWDEIFVLHEKISRPLKVYWNTSGFLHYAWVIPYAILVLIISLIFYSFVKSFPVRIRNLIFFSGFIYVLGEIGFEMISGNLISLYGPKWEFNQTQIFYHSFLITIEESFGLVGILFFNFALLKLLKIRSEIIKIRIS